MNEWAADGGKFAAIVLTFIVVGLSYIIGWFLRTLIAPPGPPTTPTELGRSWAGWVVLMSSIALLYKFFITFELFSLFGWFLGTSVLGISTFAVGWGYGKFFKFSNQPTPLPNAPPSGEHLAADDSINASDHAPADELTWLSGEQLALCETFIGKKGLRYYLPRFEKFAQQKPKLTPTFDSFSIYEYTAKFFKPSWNWSAFLFTYGWAIYRKLYGWSIVLFLTSAFCFMAMTEGAAGLGFISLIAVHIASGIYANAAYYSKAKEIVVAAARTTGSNKQGRSEVGDKGGVNLLGGWVAAGQVFVGISAILMALVAYDQQVSITGSSLGQAPLPSSSEVVDTPKMVEAPPAAPVEQLQKAPALKAGWAPVYYAPDHTVYVDLGSQRSNDSSATIKVLIDYDIVQEEAGNLYLSSVGHHQVDCGNHAIRQVFFALYSSHMGDGAPIWSDSLNQTFQPIVPRSLGEAIFISVCHT
ncbi:MAG: DUF2628 domain-containing protein [Immundisolibacter sp.]|uniref:DUF2628 domain-containing protein n=1 Tax=Immundisolibacter sp. TaxID=1934948 RepID=UPI0019BC84AE|nr:DUF2628 domain-containing protein [Immundisolibacter sp.]MBC7162002.1 DUF2628 domain-containing protein [Immundisolibacter sp.]